MSLGIGQDDKICCQAFACIFLPKSPITRSPSTHLLESGSDVRYIQELLGHTSSKTTEFYIHVSKNSLQQIKSPFDDL